MKIEDIVRIYPHGSPATAVRARVLFVSANGLSAGVDFETPPPFYRGDETRVFVNRVTGRVTMILTRQLLNGAPWGLWIEETCGGHYEIEEDLQGGSGTG